MLCYNDFKNKGLSNTVGKRNISKEIVEVYARVIQFLLEMMKGTLRIDIRLAIFKIKHTEKIDL